MWTSMLFLCSVLFVSAFKDYGIPGWTCDEQVMKRSATVPQSVHSLRFADIDVIAAIGDSLTAGNGAGAAHENDRDAVYNEYRGLAFSVGGDEELEQHVSLANILKKFNPKLFGFSVKNGSANDWASAQLNAAVPGAKAINLTSQAIDLVQRFTDNSDKVDIAYDWKLIHLFIGGNDACDWCDDRKDSTPHLFGQRIKEAIQILKDNLPRTIVVITGMMDITVMKAIGASSPECTAAHKHLCPCNFNVSSEESRGICNEYMKEEDYLQYTRQFSDSDDFTVIVQPFLQNIDRLPLLPDGNVDKSLFAPDCFHFSAYGHALVAKSLWNNMLQSFLAKSMTANLADLSTPLKCPDPSCPFIRTTKNSWLCDDYLTPVSQ